MTISAAEAMYEIVAIRERLNLISRGFSQIGPIFGPISLELPKLRPSELGFIKSVSWFYVHYFEIGKIGTEFLSSYFSLGEVSPVEMSDHRMRIQRLRTYCQHNLNFLDTHSQAIQLACEEWFKEKCSTHLPSEDQHWERLLNSIVIEAVNYFRSLERILRAIETDENREDILEELRLRITRYQAPHKFDKVIEEVTQDWGRDNFNVVKFRSRYYDRWKKVFENRDDDCDFVVEARKLVEQALLAEERDLMPLDGRDIMQLFNIPPGRKVKEALQAAQDLYISRRCTREQLLDMLRSRILEVQDRSISNSEVL